MSPRIPFKIPAFLVVSFGLALAAHAQFETATNSDNTITITGYTGVGGNVVIPTSISNLMVTSIGNAAFSQFLGLTSITIPDSVTYIGDDAFLMCGGLTNVTIGTNVTVIGDEAFRQCVHLTSVILPDSVTSIEGSAFFMCYGLTNATVGNNINSIGGSAFEFCAGLTNITIPNTVTNIGGDAFNNCSHLTSITIPDGVTSIADLTFIDCTSLSNVTIGTGVSSMGVAVFDECSSLNTILFQGNAPSFVGTNTFYGDPVTVYRYQLATGWGPTFADAPVVVLGPLSTPPSIAIQPQDVLTNAHDVASFSVTVYGTLPLSYQWSLNGSNILGATSSSLTIPNVKQSDLGTYAVAVTNSFGMTNSSNAVLSMNPFLAESFTGAITYWGYTNTLSVEAWGTGPLSFQWFDDGVAIQNATNESLTLASIQFTNAGLYTVVVSNAFGSVTNTPEQVVVEPSGVSLGLRPSITISGVVGYNYTIQSTTDLADTNAWITLTNLNLEQPVQLWVDTNTDVTLPANPRRFYRVLPGQ